MTLEEMEELVKKEGSVRQAAKFLQVPRTTFRHQLCRARRKAAGTPVRNTGVPGRSLQDFRVQYVAGDRVSAKINDALERLGDSWLYELEFAKLADISAMELSRARDGFLKYVVDLPAEQRRVWAGSVELAKQMREALDE